MRQLRMTLALVVLSLGGCAEEEDFTLDRDETHCRVLECMDETCPEHIDNPRNEDEVCSDECVQLLTLEGYELNGAAVAELPPFPGSCD